MPGSHKQQNHNGGGYRGAESMARNGHHTNSDCHSIDRVDNREEAKLASDDKALSLAEEKRGNGYIVFGFWLHGLLVGKVNIFGV